MVKKADSKSKDIGKGTEIKGAGSSNFARLQVLVQVFASMPDLSDCETLEDVKSRFSEWRTASFAALGLVVEVDGQEIERYPWATTAHPDRPWGYAVKNILTGEYWMNARGTAPRFYSNVNLAHTFTRELNDQI